MTRRHVLTLTLAFTFMTAACSSPDSDRSAAPTGEQGQNSSTHEANTNAIEGDLEKRIDKKLSGPPWNKPVAGTRVTCPTGVQWQVGDSFRCDVASRGFPRGFAEVTLEDDDGKYSWYITNQ